LSAPASANPAVSRQAAIAIQALAPVLLVLFFIFFFELVRVLFVLVLFFFLWLQFQRIDAEDLQVSSALIAAYRFA
jgi:hypothetical protein